MSYPGEPPDDTDDLAGLGGMDVSAAGLRNQSSTNEVNRKAREAARELKYYAPRRALYEKYGKELEARRAGPSSAERLYEIGAALAAPSKQPGFGGIIADVAPVMAAQRKAMREAEDDKSAMLTKYKIDVGEQQGAQLKEEQDAAAASEKEQLALLTEMYKAQSLAKQKLQNRPLPPLIEIAQRLYPSDVLKQKAYILANSPAAIKATSPSPKESDAIGTNPPWEGN